MENFVCDVVQFVEFAIINAVVLRPDIQTSFILSHTHTHTHTHTHSAGIGRTGAFCALSTAIERVKAEGIVDVFHTVKHLRTQRPHMVQTVVSRILYLSPHCAIHLCILYPGNFVSHSVHHSTLRILCGTWFLCFPSYKPA